MKVWIVFEDRWNESPAHLHLRSVHASKASADEAVERILARQAVLEGKGYENLTEEEREEWTFGAPFVSQEHEVQG